MQNYTFCLFDWGFSSHLRIFHSYGDDTITSERLQILTFARTHDHWAVRALNLACYIYCNRIRRLRNGLERSPRKRKVGCSNPSRDRRRS